MGFLGRNATFGADLNLLVQLALGVLLLCGMLLARRGWYRCHGVCQSTALLGTLALTAIWMIPALRDVYAPGLAGGTVHRVNVSVVAHAGLGSVVLLLGMYVVLVAGTPLIPERWRFRNYKAWMRTLLVLWWATILLGALLYGFVTG